MKKLCVFTLYSSKGASSNYRAYLFKQDLANNFDVKWYPFWKDEYITKYMHNKKKYALPIIFMYLVAVIERIYQLTFIAPKADIIFLQKASIPKFRKTFLNRIQKKGKRIVFDVDDAIYVDPSDNSNLIADISDCVICGNNNLIEHYSKFSSNCVYLPTVENTALYEPYWNDTYDNKIIGWIGSKTTIDNLDLVIDALNTVTSRHQNVKIAIISNTALDYLDKIHNSYLISWNSETYIEEIGKFTIGIMPLKDNEINRGKCGFKMIQYLNMKKPVIGSGVGVNSDIIRGNGIEANSTEEWVDAMEELLFNRRFYNGLVNSIEKGFFEKYHYKKISSELIKILEGNANA